MVLIVEKNIVYRKKENIDKIKYFTNLLLDNNYSIDKIKIYESDSEFINFKFRIINLLASHPRLLYYINKHFNNYESYSIPNYVWFDSLRSIIHLYNITEKNSFKYTKFRQPERKNFKTIISDMYGNLNNSDLNELFRLYSIKIINNDHLNSLKLTDKSNKTITTQNQQSVQQVKNNFEISENVINKHTFNQNIQSILETKNTCKKCKYFKSDKLFIDGNINNLNDIQILFINDFSDIEDYKRNKIYFDEKYLEKLKNIKYLIVNLVPCDIRNEFNVFKNTVTNCSGLMTNIIDQIKSRFKVLIGPRSREFYKLKIKLNSKFINTFNGNYFILPSLEESVDKFEEGFDQILSLAKKDHDTLSSYVNTVKKENPNLTLFDIKIVKNNVLYIFCDENGQKQYFIEEVKFPVYIKYGNYRQCDYIEKNVDEVSYLNVNEKATLNGQMIRRLSQTIKLGN